MNYVKIISAIIVLCASFVVSAAGEGGIFKVTSLRVNNNTIFVAFDPAPAACNGGSQYRMHARVRQSATQNYNAMLSMLLTAYTTGQTLKYIWYAELSTGVTSCGNNGDEILELNSFELTHK